MWKCDIDERICILRFSTGVKSISLFLSYCCIPAPCKLFLLRSRSVQNMMYVKIMYVYNYITHVLCKMFTDFHE